MSPSLTLRAFAAAVLFGVACSTPTQPAGPIAVRPGGTSFTREPGTAVTVPYTVANAGTASVLVTSRCGDHLLPAIEQHTGAGWVQYSGGICLAIYPMSPVPLGAGETRKDSVSVGEVGDYRLVLGTDRGQATSAAFTVR